MLVKISTVLLLASMAGLQLIRAQEGSVTDCTSISDELETSPIIPVTGKTLHKKILEA